jgi:hypothetical protein
LSFDGDGFAKPTMKCFSSKAVSALLATGLLVPSIVTASESAKVDFTRDIRPLLSHYCFKCHGPDEKANKAGLRLDRRDAATSPADSGKAPIVPGRPEQSELVRRIFAEKKAERMPPASTKTFLTEAQKQTLKRWIAEGAEYKQHWAFIRPRQAPLPAVQHRDWPRNAIDYFILARLEKEGLAPSPEANRYALIRRLSLDLIGLPPTPEEVEAFVNDLAPDAYDRLVDRLLASPAYGERWARRWLDLARYADTNGYEQDRPRSIWPYRDWVIDALSRDMPFDQFTIDQLAGDLLPGAGRSQKVATGFHRNTMLNEEGGIDPLEFRFYALVDRVNTTGTTWLGLTVGCAQCHAHKYDPIPQREFYQLMAFLNNADEPELDLPRPEVDEQHRQDLTRAAQLLAELPRQFPVKAKTEKERASAVQARFNEWLRKEQARTVPWTTLRPTQAKSNLPLLTVQPDDSVFVSGDITKRDVYELKFHTDLQNITAIRLEALADERLPRHGPGRVYYGSGGNNGGFFLSELTLLADGKKVSFSGASHSFAANGSPAAKAVDGDPQSGWSINGGQGSDHYAVFNLVAPLAGVKEFTLRLLFERYYAADLGRFRISVTTDSRRAEARDLPTELDSLLLLAGDELTAGQRQRLFEQFLLSAPELAKQAAEIRRLRRPAVYPTTLVLQERPAENPRPTYLHKRGEFLRRAEKVEPGTLSALQPFPKDLPRNRLGLARWLVSPDNPLTARVTVNRQWQAFFGRGLVRTLEDFGTQGEAPTHPELLDWLAVDFVQQGWSLKKLHRLIVTSATYRQVSRTTPALLARDPENRLLGRFPRVRLEAELIRDLALRDAGLLSQKMGGASVYPPQPPGVTEVSYSMMKWTPSPGEDRYRRGLYTFTKRTAPFAMFTTFDGPSGETCVARRDVSTTPLQALTMLNDGVIVEAAQGLGRLIAARAGTVQQKADYLFRRCLSRPPDAGEQAKLVRFYEAQRQRFARGELDAGKVAGPGSGEAAERAAWTVLARGLLNTDEAITK